MLKRMNKYFITVALLLICSATAQAADEVRVATFNCEFLVRSKVHIKFGHPFRLTGTDLTTWSNASHRDQKFNEAAKAVAVFLDTIDADVLVLTEVGDQQDVNELKAEIAALGLSYPHVVVCKSGDSMTGQHVAVLSKRPLQAYLTDGNAIIPGRELYDKELDDPETEADTGISKGLHVSFEAGDTETHLIHLYGLHLASERGEHNQDAQRIAQASIARRDYLKHLNAGEHVIVAGDLNDHRGQPALRRIRGRDDIYGDLIQTGHANIFKTDRDQRWTYEFMGVRQQIDHMLISRSIRDACGVSNIKPQVVSQTSSLVSDHRPFVLDLKFR